MSFLLKDMTLIETNENNIKEQEENLQEIKKQLEEIFISENAEIAIEVLRRDVNKIETAIKNIKRAYTKELNFKIKSRAYESLYKNITLIKNKYYDFITNDSIAIFRKIEIHAGWKKEIYKASSLISEIQETGRNNNASPKVFEKCYKVVATILQAVEEYSRGAEKAEIERIQHFAEDFIEYFKPLNSIAVFKKMINTAKAILWEIEKQKNQHQNTVGSLLDFLKTSPEWAGDDFEECLEYINEVRRE